MCIIKIFKGVTFDDVILCAEYGDWSQICLPCQKKHPKLKKHLSDHGQGFCGVQGCGNPDIDQTLYVNF